MIMNKCSSQDKLTYVFDMDGVIYRGMELMPYAREAILTLREQGHKVHFFTNNSGLSRRSYADKLNSLQIPTSVDDIMTSSYATAIYLKENGASGKTAFKIGGEGIREELNEIGMTVYSDDENPDAHIDYVVVGLDRNFNYPKLARAQMAIVNGAKFVATNADSTLPQEGGTVLPGGGCMVAAVEKATSVKPHVVGKPKLYAFEKILEITNSPAEKTIMVGDRLETDVLVGNKAGAQSVLVLTGISTKEEADMAEGDMKPDVIIETLRELVL